jgi:protein CpxP
MSNEDTTTPSPASPRRRARWLGLLALSLVSLFAMGAAFAGGPGKHCGAHGQWADDPEAAAAFVATKIANRADATEAQEAEIEAIVHDLIVELAPMRAEKEAFRAQVKEALLAETVDPAQLETLRAQALARADEASVTVTEALGELAGVLTPEQRADLADDLEQMRERLQR